MQSWTAFLMSSQGLLLANFGCSYPIFEGGDQSSDIKRSSNFHIALTRSKQVLVIDGSFDDTIASPLVR